MAEPLTSTERVRKHRQKPGVREARQREQRIDRLAAKWLRDVHPKDYAKVVALADRLPAEADG